MVRRNRLLFNNWRCSAWSRRFRRSLWFSDYADNQQQCPERSQDNSSDRWNGSQQAENRRLHSQERQNVRANAQDEQRHSPLLQLFHCTCAACASRVPHAVQNFVPGVIGLPHLGLGQTAGFDAAAAPATGLPQLVQNFEPGFSGFPQDAQAFPFVATGLEA